MPVVQKNAITEYIFKEKSEFTWRILELFTHRIAMCCKNFGVRVMLWSCHISYFICFVICVLWFLQKKYFIARHYLQLSFCEISFCKWNIIRNKCDWTDDYFDDIIAAKNFKNIEMRTLPFSDFYFCQIMKNTWNIDWAFFLHVL